ncbi:MAG TPA: hypothetical protein VFN97_28535, partial [Actinospica sp.]|nr:hypothetical protein [Actinospica sp.]
MQEQRFDQLTRRLSTATSRRQALKILAGAVVGGLFAGRASGAAATTCKGIGEACSGRLPWECCTRFCGPDGVCGCPFGLESCGGVCHLPCLSGAVRDANCRCSCPPGTTFCLDDCSNLQQGTVINPNSPPERQLVTNCGHCGFTCGPGLICHGGDCCAGPGGICTAIGLGSNCCTGECSATGKCCSQLTQQCSAASDCCQPGAVCGPGNTCCVQDGQVCSSSEECCNRVCNPATG